MGLQWPPGARYKLPDALLRLPCFELLGESINDDFPDCRHTYRGAIGPVLDDILFTENGVNEVIAPVAESVAGLKGVTFTPAYVEDMPEEVDETSLLPGAY